MQSVFIRTLTKIVVFKNLNDREEEISESLISLKYITIGKTFQEMRNITNAYSLNKLLT